MWVPVGSMSIRYRSWQILIRVKAATPGPGLPARLFRFVYTKPSVQLAPTADRFGCCLAFRRSKLPDDREGAGRIM
jgi:hypothetical protein